MSDHHGNTGLLGRAWFKPLVGAWFALLLGGGMWLMPPHVHALIARSIGLAQLHPMFAPPVSGAGVAVLCISVALFGLLLGIAVAGRIASAAAPRAFAPGFEFLEDSAWRDEAELPTDGLEEPRRRRVFSARDDIGEEGIAMRAPTEEASYENEYSLDDVPPAGPAEEFEAVYAEMEGDSAIADEDVEEVGGSREDETGGYAVFETEDVEIAEDAEFEHVPEFDPAPEVEPIQQEHAEDGADPDTTRETPAMGDMSLEGLLDRLEGALEQHKRMVAESEEAAERPAPQPIPITRGLPAEEDCLEDQDLPQASDDDPVIAFLRREASRRMPEAHADLDAPEEGSETGDAAPTDAQAALRSALERLGQVNRRD
ncbi:hypothetical protein GRI69_12060 [Erythrobacter vulgaris]|uniref:Uncharacterized protein n=1 Tax=Qipengyuania vulgaris TaxID=291985 RepID=A0A844XV32_9SPHN|nr:hypothetical protein [Qipengyuania vulgaris]MXO48993.1 hypothetical protein [Qipengyuania vulgaris]